MSWRVVKLGELIENFSVKAKDFNVDVSKLDFFGVSNTDGITMSKYAAEDKANDYKIMEKGCFAYNPYRVNVGSIAMLKDDIVGLISPAYVVFKVKEKSIIPELLLKFLKSSEGLRQIKLHARGTVRQALRFSDLCEIKISLPDYEEQIEFYKLISNTEIESKFLSTHLTHQLDLVKKLRQSFLREAMQGKLTADWRTQHPDVEPATHLLAKIKAEKEQLIKDKKIRKQKPLPPISKEEIPFEIPDNWDWCRLGLPIFYADNLDIQKKLSAETIINYVDIDSIDNSKQLIREVKTRRVSELSTRARRILKKGFIVYSTVRPYLRNIAIVEDELPQMIGTTGFNVFKPILINTKYIFYFLLNPDLNKEFEEMMIGFNSPSITNVQFENTLLPLPPLTEQKRIVAKLDELMRYCDSLEESINNSQSQNEMLLGQVLREALEPKEKEVEKV